MMEANAILNKDITVLTIFANDQKRASHKNNGKSKSDDAWRTRPTVIDVLGEIRRAEG